MDEKQPLLPDPNRRDVRVEQSTSNSQQAESPKSRWWVCGAFVLLLLGIKAFSVHQWWKYAQERTHSHHPVWQDDTDFDWTKVEPSSKLKYVPCHGKHYCARLEVPLDWNSTRTDGAKAILALIKRPAEVDVTHPTYGGAILFNPGGPGGSGVQFMSLYGQSLAAVLNGKLPGTEDGVTTNNSRFYDLISWDPRGVGNTTPFIEGYTNPLIRQQFDQRFMDLSDSWHHPEVFNQMYELKGLFGKLISSSQDAFADDEHPAKFVGTSSVVRDMIEIIEKHGEWRHEAAEKTIKQQMRQGHSFTASELAAIRNQTRHVKGHEKLQYWGYSYGTIVGQTFASMYPDRVGRLAIDGVVNATDYYAGGWKTELIDTDALHKNFTLECEAAGPESCPLAKLVQGKNETLSDALERSLDEIKSVPITGLADKEPIFVTNYMVTLFVFSLFYSGLPGYRISADLLWHATSRNASYFNVKLPDNSCERSQEATIDRSVPQVAIVCSDSAPKWDETREDYWDYLLYLNKQSKHYGKLLARIMIPCHSYSVRPKWRFDGPFGAKTANPILVLSQTLDPITPLTSAKGAASLFPGSQVVEAQGIGHCTLGYPSICAMREVKKYFHTGQVPKEYTRCAAAIKPFRSMEEALTMTNELPDEDRNLMPHLLHIANSWPPGNEGLERYGKNLDLPGGEMGAWWAVHKRTIFSEEMEAMVHAQY